MQVDISRQGRNHSPLGSTHRRGRPLTFLRYPGPEPLTYQAQDPPVRNAVLQKLDEPLVRQTIEKPTDVQIKNPVHLLAHDPHPQRIQRLMLAAPRTESVGESHKVLFIDTVEDRHESLLNDFVLQGGYPQRPLPPILLSYVGSPRRLRSVSAPVDSLLQRHELFLQTLAVLPPCHFVYTGSRIALKRQVARPQ